MHNDSLNLLLTQPTPVDTHTIKPLLLSTKKTAELLGVTVRTIYNWDELGHLPQPVRIGGSLCWRSEELVAWIEAGCPKRDDWRFQPKRK